MGDFIRVVSPGSGGHCAIIGLGAEWNDEDEKGTMEVGRGGAARGRIVVKREHPRCVFPLQEGQGIDGYDADADECSFQLSIIFILIKLLK